MPSRLSSLLVRDGLVGVKRMEKAFQRQVIYGGSLDTILLEMNLIPEDRLVQYLALASGLPPAARDEGHAIEPEAVALIARDLAEQYRAVPVALEGDAVRVLVCAPLEIAELEDLADLLDRALQPLIAPEYRWNLVFAAAYGIDPPARFTQLARSLDGDPSTPAVGRAKSIIIDAPEIPDLSEVTEVSAPPTMSPATAAAVAAARLPQIAAEPDTLRLPPPSRRPATERPRRHTIVGVQPNRARTDSMPAVQVPDEPAAGDSGRLPARDFGEPASRDSGSIPPIRGPRTAPRPPSAPISEGRDSPLPIVRARELLAGAEDRDTVFLTLLRAARSRAKWAGLLTVQGGAAIGRLALAEPGIDAKAVTTVLIPLDVVSPFRNVISSQQSHIGPLVSGDAGIDAMVARMGGAMPPSALILPIILRDRVVAIVVAHRVQSDIRLADVAELLPMAHATSEALGRLIVRQKTQGFRAPTVPPGAAVEIEDDSVVTRRISRPIAVEPEPVDWDNAPTDSAASLPTAPIAQLAAVHAGSSLSTRAPVAPILPLQVDDAVPSGIGGLGRPSETEISIEPDPPTPIDEVLWAIQTGKPGAPQAEAAFAEAIARAPETLEALAKKFPGKLRVDRFAVSGRALRAAQYGALLELIVRMGPAADDLVIDKLGAPQRDVRFYATVCAIELRPRSAVFVLADRLFDQDYGVRACAIEALAGYPPAELEEALARVRRAIHAADPEQVNAAAQASVELGDVEAIGDLIAVIERGGRIGEHARRALVALAAQDFGTSERKWRKWWEGARKRHRIEWLIEGLSHKEDAIREAAIDDLRRLTGEYFGYHHDLPRRERDAAAGRWAGWWRETGQRRFTPGESERHRPTAKLPPRGEEG